MTPITERLAEDLLDKMAELLRQFSEAMGRPYYEALYDNAAEILAAYDAFRTQSDDAFEAGPSMQELASGESRLGYKYFTRTHPAEGGEGRDYVLVPREPTEAMVSAGFDVHPCRTGETKVTDAYKSMLAAAPPPQPVAPERGEAKAVACRMRIIAHGYEDRAELFKWSYYDLSDYSCEIPKAGGNLQVEQLYAAPQPPPAPRFRDPTIEDDLRAIADDVDPNHDPMPSNHPLWDPYKQADRLRQIANAIGAKVEEK